MASVSRHLRGFTDEIVQHRIHSQRDAFIRSISKQRIIALASSQRPGIPCDYFQEPKRGSFNICYFIRFANRERLVIRVPLAPCLALGARSKLESEIATMQLLANNTAIPVPKIYGYKLGDGPDPLSCYLILEFVEGRSLSPSELDSLSRDQRTRLYASLADVYIQLRRLTFPSVGCLTRGASGYRVGKRPATIDLNMQELEGLRPSEVQARYGNSGNVSSANDYTNMLLQLADNAFARSRSRVFSQEQGEDALYHQHIFRQFVMKEWIGREPDRGPFVLLHGDLQPYNCLLNQRMEITSVLDWEWARVVPVQFFNPPLWLTALTPEALAWDFAYGKYLQKFDEFLGVLRGVEHKRYGNTLLHDEWTRRKSTSGFLLANALENSTDMDALTIEHISWKWFGGTQDVAKRISDFIRQDPRRRDMIQRLVRANQSYQAEVQRLRRNNRGR